MYEFISIDVIYLFLLIDSVLKNRSAESVSKLVDFFNLYSVPDKISYLSLVRILPNVLDVSYLRSFVLENRSDKKKLVNYLSKIYKILRNHFEPKLSKLSVKEIISKLENIKNILVNFEDEYAVFLFLTADFLLSRIKDTKDNYNFILLFSCLEEYFDMFLYAYEIDFDSEMIHEFFKMYFNALHVNPQCIVFYNKKENIKIIQDFFKFEQYANILKLSGFSDICTPNKKYFLMEIDKTQASKNEPQFLFHELGHLLNLKIFYSQDLILNDIFAQNPNVNYVILSYWLNEIMADTIGYHIYKDNSFPEKYGLLKENLNDYTKYPPNKLRKALLTGEEYDLSQIENEEARCVAELVVKCSSYIKDFVKTMLD